MKEFEGKKLLVLGGIKTECDIVKTAKEMGAYVIVADYDPNCPAKEFADELVNISATDIDAIVKLCKEKRIDGITTGFVDILLKPCYEACMKLGYPCYITPKMLSMSTNKVDFKDTCRQYGIPVPRTYLIGETIPQSLFNEIQYPVFVKPLDASGSRGAGACYNDEQLVSQFNKALSFSNSNIAIIEEYSSGREFLLDYVGVNGEFRLLSMFDRYMSLGRGTAINYSNVCLCPPKQINQYYKEINPKVQKMFKELGFTDGLIFLQGHTDGDKISFYEMGCRLGGSFFNLEEAVLGLNPVEMTIRYALNGQMMNSIERISANSSKFSKVAMVANYLLEGVNETIASVEGVEQVKSLESFVSLIQHKDIGYRITEDSIVDKPIFSFFMVGKDLSDIKESLSFMNDKLKVTNSKGESLLSARFNPDNL